MGGTLGLCRPLCHSSVRLGTRTKEHTGDARFFLLRETLDRTALIDYLEPTPKDLGDSRSLTHSLASLQRNSVAVIAKGWGDPSDAARLHDELGLLIAPNAHPSIGVPGIPWPCRSLFRGFSTCLAGRRTDYFEVNPRRHMRQTLAKVR
jgi:hypothetical protein